MKEKKIERRKLSDDAQSIIFTIGVIVLLVGLALILDPLIKRDNQKNYEFYKEWCPKLGAELIEPVEGYTYQPRCFIEEDKIVKIFFIMEINGEYKLREVSLD